MAPKGVDAGVVLSCSAKKVPNTMRFAYMHKFRRTNRPLLKLGLLGRHLRMRHRGGAEMLAPAIISALPYVPLPQRSLRWHAKCFGAVITALKHYSVPIRSGLGDPRGTAWRAGARPHPLVGFFGIFLAETRKIPAGGNYRPPAGIEKRTSPGPGGWIYICSHSQGRIGSKLAPKGVDAGVTAMACSTNFAAREAATCKGFPKVSAPVVTAANISPVPC